MISAALLALASLFTPKGEVPHYVPDPSIELLGQPRTGAEHDRLYRDAGDCYVVRLNKGSGELLLLGVHHTQDPAAPQLERIAREFEAFKPDVAFVEGRPRLFSTDFANAVKQYGEPGAVYATANQAGVDCYTFEPTREVEAQYLLERFDREFVAFGLFWRGYLSDRRTGPVPDLVAKLLLSKKQRQYGLEGTLKDLADADRVWARISAKGNWRTVEEREFWPNANGSVMQKMASATNEVRDAHLVRSLITELRKGKRVFVVAGMSHAIFQEPVIRATAERD